MKHSWRFPLSLAQCVLIAVPVVLVLLPLAIFTHYMVQKHSYLAQQLEEIEPRYARLLALEQQKEVLTQTLQTALQRQQRDLYSAKGDAAQIGNNAQNRVRGALLEAGLSISSSQVKVEKSNNEGEAESIVVSMTVDGTLGQIQRGLFALEALRPRVWLDQVRIAHRGTLMNANPNVDPVLSVRMVFSVPRSKEST